MFTISREELSLLEPGMRVRITSELQGAKLYGGEDPEDFKEWCGSEVTVRIVSQTGSFPVGIVEDVDAWFCIEEIECVVEDAEIEESDESLVSLFGGMV